MAEGVGAHPTMPEPIPSLIGSALGGQPCRSRSGMLSAPSAFPLSLVVMATRFGAAKAVLAAAHRARRAQKYRHVNSKPSGPTPV